MILNREIEVTEKKTFISYGINQGDQAIDI